MLACYDRIEAVSDTKETSIYLCDNKRECPYKAYLLELCED